MVSRYMRSARDYSDCLLKPFKERIRNTLSHEMCHLACWVINQEPKEGHGKFWKSWCVEALLPVYMWKTHEKLNRQSAGHSINVGPRR